MNAAWRKVVPPLAGEFRCIAPDWPLGSHTIPMNDDADLSPRGKRIRENGRRFVRGIDYGDLPRAAEKLRFFEKPVLILWAREDRLFPYAFAERWMTALPNARLVPVPDSYTYVAEDQPEFVSRDMASFALEVGAHADTERSTKRHRGRLILLAATTARSHTPTFELLTSRYAGAEFITR